MQDYKGREFSLDEIMPYNSFSIEKEDNLKHDEILYRIEPNCEYYIMRMIFAGRTSHYIVMYKPTRGGRGESWGKREIHFADKSVNIPTGSIIKIHKASERFYYSRTAKRTMTYLHIIDFELVKEGDAKLDTVYEQLVPYNKTKHIATPEMRDRLGDMELPFIVDNGKN